MTQYIDVKGRLIFVRAGLGGDCFMTMYQNPGKAGAHRLKSQQLPLRRTVKEAQNDLAEYARIKKFKIYGGNK